MQPNNSPILYSSERKAKEEVMNIDKTIKNNLPVAKPVQKKEVRNTKTYTKRKKASPNDEKKNVSDESNKLDPTKPKRKAKEKRKSRAFTRRLWGDEEDKAITMLVKKHGTKKWTLISRQLQEEYKIYGRSGKQCRERYIHK